MLDDDVRLAQAGNGDLTLAVHHGDILVSGGPGQVGRSVRGIEYRVQLHGRRGGIRLADGNGRAGVALRVHHRKLAGIALHGQLEGRDLAAAAGSNGHGAGCLGGDNALMAVAAGRGHGCHIRVAGSPIHGGIGALLGGNGGKEDVRKLLGILADDHGFGALIQRQRSDLGSGEHRQRHKDIILDGLIAQITHSGVKHGAGPLGGGLADHSAGNAELRRDGILAVLARFLGHAGGIDAGGGILRPVKGDGAEDMLLGILPLQNGIGAAGLEEEFFCREILIRGKSLGEIVHGVQAHRLHDLVLCLNVAGDASERSSRSVGIERIGECALAHNAAGNSAHIGAAGHGAKVVNILDCVVVLHIGILRHAVAVVLKVAVFAGPQIGAAKDATHILTAGDISRIVAVPNDAGPKLADKAAHIFAGGLDIALVGAGDHIGVLIMPAVIAGENTGNAAHIAHARHNALVQAADDHGVLAEITHNTARIAILVSIAGGSAGDGADVGAVGNAAILADVTGNAAHAGLTGDVAQVVAVLDGHAAPGAHAAQDAAHILHARCIDVHIHGNVMEIGTAVRHNGADTGYIVSGFTGIRRDAAGKGKVTNVDLAAVSDAYSAKQAHIGNIVASG